MIDIIGNGGAGRRLAVKARRVSTRTKAVILCAAIVAGGAAAASWALDGAGAKDQLRSRELAPGGPRAFETRYGIVITDSASKARWATIRLDKLGLPRESLLDFYAQSNAVAEFLAEATGDPKILGRVARSLKRRPHQPDGQHQSWITDIAVEGDQPLAGRFADWARASARAGKASCAASASAAFGSRSKS